MYSNNQYTWVIEQEPEVFERVAKAAIQKRTSALKEAKKMEEKFGYLPVLTLRESDAFAHVKVADIMTKHVKTVRENITVSQLLELMAQQHHIGYPVVNAEEEPVGTITLEAASAVGKEKRDTTLVNQIMRKNPVYVSSEDTALDVFRKMSEFETGRVLVVDYADSRKLVGIVTKSDLMHTMIEQG